jgi:hypothetical protein
MDGVFGLGKRGVRGFYWVYMVMDSGEVGMFVS